MTHFRVGVDIGGTFTDFALHDTRTHKLVGIKVPTVPADPVRGVLAGLKVLREEHGVEPTQIGYFVHGTTIGVNALIERRGARLGLLVTRGFRDLLLIQRLRLPQPQNWYGARAVPLIPREYVYEIDERLAADGSVHQELSLDTVAAAAAQARASGLEGLVICFLHAFRNPEHERVAREFLAHQAPDIFVCCSHEIWPQMREYERSIVSIINAYVMPPVSSYLTKLQQELRDLGVPAEPYITRSNGGIMSARRASRSTAETLLSGPASGVIGAVRVAQQAGIKNLITLDVGGTSADVAIVEDGAPHNSLSEHIADLPIMMPVLGVTCVGAGGGSIAVLDAAGVLKVGPESAGADPGPACFGKGGTQATVTDALLLCGYLNAATYAGGRLALDLASAHRVIGQMATPLGMTPEQLAEGILTVTVAGMYAELSNLTAKRGIDVREFTLVGFGGAGALLACRVADELGIHSVLVPPSPGTLCALGALSADAASDFIRSVVLRSGADLRPLRETLQALKKEGLEWIRCEAPSTLSQELSISADMRYVGQSFEVETPLDARAVEEGDWAAIADAFHASHRRVYSHAEPGLPVEMVSLRLRISATMPKPPLAPPPQTVVGTPAPRAGSRGVLIEGRLSDVASHDRTALAGGHVLYGPALVDQVDTTVYVPAGWRGLVHESGSLLLSRKPA